VRSQRVKVLGTRHSFNGVADTAGDLVSLRRFDRILALDRDPRHPTVTIEAGVRYGELCRYLNSAGYALHNLASLPHISVAGACATATHGSGDRNGNLATAVAAMELVTADGEVRSVSRASAGDAFDGTVVHLGGLGVVTKLTLNVVPAFDVAQEVYLGLPVAPLAAHFETIMSGGYSVSLFTDWTGEAINQVWVKRRAADAVSSTSGPASFGATPAARDLHPIASILAINCTPQMGVPGPWHERLPHFRLEFTPSSGEELQSEYFVPRHHAVAALRAIGGLRDRVAPLLQISEVRAIAADELWMSPCYRQPCVAIHFTWKKDWTGVSALLPTIEATLSPFGARPHWGKLFTMTAAQLQPRYERLADFRRLIAQYDPRGKFRNAFLDRCLFGV
jgi:xylitol oxidase